MRQTKAPNVVTSPFDIFNSEGYKARLTFDTSEAFNLLMNTSPPGAPAAALAGVGAGALSAGDYFYRVTFITATGETNVGTKTAVVTVADPAVNGQINLTAIPTGPIGFVTQRKIYRTAAGGNDYKLVATIADNTTTTYLDNIADAALGAIGPTANTTLDVRLTVNNAGQVLHVDGTTALPSIAFLSDPDTGFMWNASGNIGIVINASRRFLYYSSGHRLGASMGFEWSSNADPNLATYDLRLSRAAGNVLLLDGSSAGAAAAFRRSGGNGSYLSHGITSELLNIAAAAFTDSAFVAAVGTVIVAVAVRVVTVIPTAATFTVTGAVSGVAHQTAPVAVAAGSTDPGTAAGGYYIAAAEAIRITPNIPPLAATGQVRLAIYVYTAVPPTS